MTANSTSQLPAREQLSTKDNSVMYGAGYALVTVLLVWIDWCGLPTNNSFDTVTGWIGSLCLLIACYALLSYNLEALGKAIFLDEPDQGTSRMYIGAVMAIYGAVILAVFSHRLDDKIFLFKLFWIQVPALPGAYIAAKYLGETLDGKAGLKTLCAYISVNLLLWLHLQNFTISDEDRGATDEEALAIFGFVLGLLVLLFANVVLLISCLEYVVEARVEEIPNGRVLVTLGAFMGIAIMVLGVVVPLELAFHVLDGKHWMYQILLAEQGALPGAYLIEGSAWLAKIYAGRESILPQYSTIDTEESQT